MRGELFEHGEQFAEAIAPNKYRASEESTWLAGITEVLPSTGPRPASSTPITYVSPATGFGTEAVLPTHSGSPCPKHALVII